MLSGSVLVLVLEVELEMELVLVLEVELELAVKPPGGGGGGPWRLDMLPVWAAVAKAPDIWLSMLLSPLSLVSLACAARSLEIFCANSLNFVGSLVCSAERSCMSWLMALPLEARLALLVDIELLTE
jgi:hypothetical protein